MADVTTTTTPATGTANPVTTGTGTAAPGAGPGTASALEAALNEYLAAQIDKATKGTVTTPTAPTPPATGETQVITTPARSSDGIPRSLAVLIGVVGLVSGGAYLFDRHRKGKK